MDQTKYFTFRACVHSPPYNVHHFRLYRRKVEVRGRRQPCMKGKAARRLVYIRCRLSCRVAVVNVSMFSLLRVRARECDKPRRGRETECTFVEHLHRTSPPHRSLAAREVSIRAEKAVYGVQLVADPHINERAWGELRRNGLPALILYAHTELTVSWSVLAPSEVDNRS